MGLEGRTPGPASLRALWLWCAPALVLGVVLRVGLNSALPAGYFHYDSHDFLLTTEKWIDSGEWKVHKKKVPLVPWLYTAAAATGAPILRVMPLLQQAAGLAMVLAFGALVRGVCPAWRAVIIPATVLMAAHPAILWYEQVLVAESLYLVFVVLAAACCAGYHQRPGWRQWGALLVAVALAALTRPEGKILLLAPGISVLLAHFRDRRRLAAQGAALAVLVMCLSPATRTSQTGLMPLASVMHWMPDQTRAAAGAEPLLLPIRDQCRALQGQPRRGETDTRKALSAAVRQHFEANPGSGDPRSDQQVNEFCRRLALEIYLQNWFRVPALALEKFLMTIDRTPCGRFDDDAFEREMVKSMGREWPRVLRLSRQLYGIAWTTESEARAFVAANYSGGRLTWFNGWLDLWQSMVSWPHHPDRPCGLGGVLALPVVQLLALAGAVSGCLGAGRARAFHLSWLPALGALGFAIFAVAGIEARFRFVFEPFVILYAAIALGATLSWCRERLPRHQSV
jgi:hypothetical protein